MVVFGLAGDEMIVVPDATCLPIVDLADRAIKAAGKPWPLHKVSFLISGRHAGPDDEPVPHVNLRHAIGKDLRPPSLHLILNHV